MASVLCCAVGCTERFATAGQLDAHCALRHVALGELRFACALCHEPEAFHTASQLVRHRIDKHKEGGGTVSEKCLYDALAAGKDAAQALGNGAEGDKENAQPAEKKSVYACKRCAYSTDHSAWLLHKHVIYEHLVEQAHDEQQYDDEVDVPPVPKVKRACKREFYDGSTTLTAAGGGLALPLAGDGGVQLVVHADPTMDAVHDRVVDGGMANADAVQLFDTGALDYTEPTYVQDCATTSAAVAAVQYGGRGRRRGAMARGGAQYMSCVQCPYTTTVASRYRAHMRRVHGGDGGAAGPPHTLAVGKLDTAGTPGAVRKPTGRPVGSKFSSLWWYYEDHGVIDNSRVCVCTYQQCGVVVNSACHTNMMGHIRRHHPVLHKDLVDRKETIEQFETDGGL